MRRQIANIITGCRLLCSLFLLFCPVFSPSFYALYLFGGLTDMVDGAVARRTNAVSSFGAKLDTVADIAFTAVSLFKILPVISMQNWLWIWTGLIGAIKIGNYMWGLICRKRLVSLHTVSNKITGLLLFLLPLTLPFVRIEYSAPVLCALATFAAIQEGYYIGKGREVL